MNILEIERVVESVLYAVDLDAAERFYRLALGLQLLTKELPRQLFFRAGESMVLIFNPQESCRPGQLPSHGAQGAGHIALGVRKTDLSQWRTRLFEHGVPIEQAVSWPRGGESLYVRDPAGNLVELITKGCWGLPSGW